MSGMWECYRCGEIGMGTLPDVHAYRSCDVTQYGEDFARARVEAWNAAIATTLAITSPRFGITWDVTELIRNLKREERP